MTPKTQLPLGTDQERQRQSRVQSGIERLLCEFAKVRNLYGRRRYGRIDRALGRKPGFLNLVLTGRERLSLERLLASLDFLGVSFHWFFRRVFPRPGLPGAAVGFLPRRKDQVRRRPLISFLDDLLIWGSKVDVAASGADFAHDPDRILEVLRVNPAAAFRMAVAALEGLLALNPERLRPDSAENLCRLLLPLADTLRVRGDRNSACDLLDLAFRIESQLENAELRAFIYRTGAFLLSDLGYLPDAEDFAAHSLDLTTSCADLEGIGRSWYIRGLMLHRQGAPSDAVCCFTASLRYQDWLTRDVRIAALLELAVVHLECRDLTEARSLIDEVREEIPRTGAVRAGFLRVQAELAGYEQRIQVANGLFEQAEDEYAQLGSAADVAFIRLKRIEFLLREGRPIDASALARQLIPLASQLRGSRASESLLLGLARAAFQDRLALTLVAATLETWQHPWLKPRSG